LIGANSTIVTMRCFQILNRLSKIFGNVLWWNEWAIVLKVSFIILSNAKIWRDLYKPDAGVRWSWWVIRRTILFCRIMIFLSDVLVALLQQASPYERIFVVTQKEYWWNVIYSKRNKLLLKREVNNETFFTTTTITILFFLPQRKYTCQYRHSKAGRRRKDTPVIPSATTQPLVAKGPKQTRSLGLS